MKISIITVCYNSAATLEETIQSVATQTYKNIEYIVIDGNSKDDTVNIIKKHKAVITKWISEPDKGLYDAMNKGIAMATGDVVGVLHSDDFYHSTDAISIIANSFLKSNIQCVFADLLFVHPNNINKVVRKFSSKNFKPTGFRFGNMPAHPTFFTYKTNFDRLGYYKTNYKICADYELLLRFLLVNKISYKYIPVNLLTMRTGGISTNSIKSKVLINKEFLKACNENQLKTNYIFLSLRYFSKIIGLIRLK